MKFPKFRLRNDQIFFIYILLFSAAFFAGGIFPKYILNAIAPERVSSGNTSTDTNGAVNGSTPTIQVTETIAETVSPTVTLARSIVPISSMIAYISGGEVWIGDTNNWNPEQITNDEYEKFMISVSPDRTKIVYAFFPDNGKRRTNLGTFEGYHSGVGWVSLADRKPRITVPYGDQNQHHYPSWSPDNRYLAVWSGNGRSNEIYDTISGKLVSRFESDDYIPVSSITFVPKTGRVSMIKNNKLVSMGLNGFGEIVLSETADPLVSVNEGSSMPMPPLFSNDGKFVVYFRNGDLMLLDTFKRQEHVIVPGIDSPMFGGRVPQGFPGGFFLDNNGLLIQDVTDSLDVVQYTIEASVSSRIASFGNSLLISPDKTIIGGRNYLNQFEIQTIKTGETKTCEEAVWYPYYSWNAGRQRQSGVSYWSIDGSKILIQKNITQGNGLHLLNPSTCEIQMLIPEDTAIPEYTWFP